ncbi:ATP-binding protein [Streptomyces sp. NPDC052236]|uniref:ATP-binding protein n=1 Tax=Streptomyces sp. NPDC052236 TaxID=3365686 RepID=UPI0037D8E3A2
MSLTNSAENWLVETEPSGERRKVARFRLLQVAFVREECVVPEVRQRGTVCLQRWGLAEGLIEAAGLVISEFVTNAISHSRSDALGLHLLYMGAEVRIEVIDCSPSGRPLRRQPDLLDEGGRGLWRVDAFVAEHGGDWGVSDDATVTWCTLAGQAEGETGDGRP